MRYAKDDTAYAQKTALVQGAEPGDIAYDQRHGFQKISKRQVAKKFLPGRERRSRERHGRRTQEKKGIARKEKSRVTSVGLSQVRCGDFRL